MDLSQNFYKLESTTLFSNVTQVSNITCSRFEPIPVVPHVLEMFSGISSIVGAFVIVVSFVRLASIQNVLRTMLVYLTIADFITALGNIIGVFRYVYLTDQPGACVKLQTSDAVCVVQSFMTTMSSMASFFWTVAIALHMFTQLANTEPALQHPRQLWKYHIVCWGIPGVITTVAACMNVLGQDNSVGTGGWCWIKSGINDDTQIMWMFVSGKGWELLCYLTTGVLYFMCKLTIVLKRREQRRHRHLLDPVVEGIRIEDENFLYVPLILYVLRFWGTFRFLWAISHRKVNGVDSNSTVNIAFLTLQCIGDSWQAFWNSILFCLCDATVREYLKSQCLSCWRLRCSRERTYSVNEDSPLLYPNAAT